MTIMVAQPRSNYGDADRPIEPMGDKAQFMSKVIFRIACTRTSEGRPSKRWIVIFRSRDIEDCTTLSHFITTETGIGGVNWDEVRKVVR